MGKNINPALFKKSWVKIFIVLTIVLLNPVISSSYAQADLIDPSNWLVSKDQSTASTSELQDTGLVKNPLQQNEVPESEPQIEYEVVRESFRQVTAYNVGDIAQTDSTPCTGAYSKVNLCEEVAKGIRVCAANFVPLETVLRISIGNQSFDCVVWDRMHSRFRSRVDIAMSASEKIQARQFGLQKLKVQILKEVANEDVSI